MITHFRQAIEETLPWLSSFGADPAGGMTRFTLFAGMAGNPAAI
ncbi:allantoate amidohydrolase [Escherichia coli]|nr:allantoate amidohydrolase [Escherichia coli]